MPQSRDQEVSDRSQVAPQRRRFTESFKRDAVALVTHEQYSFQAAARAVGVSDNSLRIWHKQYAPQATGLRSRRDRRAAPGGEYPSARAVDADGDGA